MADLTKTQGTLNNWTWIDDTGVSDQSDFFESAVLDSGESLDSAVSATLHIDVASVDTNAKDAGWLEVVVLIRAGATDEHWTPYRRFVPSTTTSSKHTICTASATGATRLDTTTVEGTDKHGYPLFICETSNLSRCEIVLMVDSSLDASTGQIFVADGITYATTTSGYITDVVDTWNVSLPPSIQAAKVIASSQDGDANAAIRVRYTIATDIV